MSRLAKNAATVAEAVGGHSSKGAAAAFNALHISVTDSQGKLLPLNDLLGTVAEKFSRMQDSTTKTALAIQIFGKGGAALIPFLNEGNEGLERLRQVSDDLGTTWAEKDIQAARAFGESVEILKLKGQALEEQFAKGLSPP
jgi:TP901 family phage tail tape measure protein